VCGNGSDWTDRTYRKFANARRHVAEDIGLGRIYRGYDNVSDDCWVIDQAVFIVCVIY
jgi:hypothetical protein